VQLSIGRRRFLAGGAACFALAMGKAAASSRGARRMTVAARWQTDNTLLTPSTLSKGRLYFGGDKTTGVIDLAAGRKLWQRELPHPSQFRTRVGGGIVLAGGEKFFTALSADDGKPLWQAKPEIRRIGVPLLQNGRIYHGDGNRLVARNAADGNVLWVFEGVPDTDIAYAPAATADTVFAGPGDGRLYAINAADGALRWSVNRLDQWQYLRQMYIEGGVLVAGTYKEKLLGLSIEDGRELWNVNAGNFINSHHVASGMAYFWSPTGWVYAVETSTGNVLWRCRTTDYRSSPDNWATIVAELASTDKRLFVLDLANVLHVLDISSGEELGRFATPGRVQPFIVPFSADQVFLGSATGELWQCRLSS
jgi:outer membrane protein assembly factor BamB